MGEPSEAQRLAAMKANMIADLGNIRRDAISTADDRGHAYNASQQQSTGDVQRRIQLKNIEKAAKKGDKKAEKLSAWNSKALRPITLEFYANRS